MFKSQEKLIAEIHNEFDTAQDRLLQQAKSFLDKASNNRVEEVGTRLAKVGFINSPTAKKAVPIITCKPWNPVPKQKHDPKTPSLIVNEDTLYSITCNPVNITARTIVYINPYKALALFPSIIE